MYALYFILSELNYTHYTLGKIKTIMNNCFINRKGELFHFYREEEDTDYIYCENILLTVWECRTPYKRMNIFGTRQEDPRLNRELYK